MKICPKCDDPKPSSEFHKKNFGTIDGLQSYCKVCANKDRMHRKEMAKTRAECGKLKTFGQWIEKRLTN